MNRHFDVFKPPRPLGEIDAELKTEAGRIMTMLEGLAESTLNPSIGVLLCRTKDDEVVEYAISRHISPALVAQYETRLIPKAVLQQKLHEWSLMLEAPGSQEETEA